MDSFSVPESGSFCGTVYCQLVLPIPENILGVVIDDSGTSKFLPRPCLCPNAVFLGYMHLHPVW